MFRTICTCLIALIFNLHSYAQTTAGILLYRNDVRLPDQTIVLKRGLKDTAGFKITIEAHLPVEAKDRGSLIIPLKFSFYNHTGKSLSYYPDAWFYWDSRLEYDTRQPFRLPNKAKHTMDITLYRASSPYFGKTDYLKFSDDSGHMIYIPVAFRLVYDQ